MKPSPIVSILMFVAAAALAYGLIGRGWFSVHERSISADGGPVWSTICTSFDRDGGDDGDMHCETHTFLSTEGANGVWWVINLVFVLTGLTGMVMAAIAGFILLKKPRSLMSIMTLSFAGTSFLVFLIQFLYGASKGGLHLPGHGFFVYFLGATLAIVASIIGMVRKGAGGAAPVRPGYGYPPGPGQAGYPPQAYGQQPQGYAPQYGQPQPGPAAYAPAPAPQQAYAPQPTPVAAPAAQAAAPHTCGTPTTWVAQYQRWFCTRCNQYV